MILFLKELTVLWKGEDDARTPGIYDNSLNGIPERGGESHKDLGDRNSNSHDI